MSFSLLPNEIQSIIFSYAYVNLPQAITIAQIDKTSYSLITEKLKQLQIDFLVRKYGGYNPWSHPEAPSNLLLKALSYHPYDKKVEKDIKRIVKLVPESINYSRDNRSAKTPLVEACHKAEIPPSIIELLLKNGASTQPTFSSPELFLNELRQRGSCYLGFTGFWGSAPRQSEVLKLLKRHFQID